MSTPNFLLENSIKKTSELDNILASLFEEELDEANNTTADSTPYQKLITAIIQRAHETVNFDDFCTKIETPTASGKIPYETIKYVGTKASDSALATVRVFLVSDVSTFTEGGFVSSASASGTILHVETSSPSPTGKLLVSVTSGTFAPTDALDNVATYVATKATLTAIYTPNGNYAGFLENYDNNVSTDVGETATDMKEIVAVIKNMEINCTTKHISTGYTIETLSDAIAVYGYAYKDMIVARITEMLEKIDKARIFKFMRDNAYKRPNIVLTNSYGAQGSILDIFGDIYTRINQSAGTIKKNTNIDGEFVVLASTNIYRALITTTPLSEIEKKTWLPSDIVLIEDPFSIQDYICVSLNNQMTSGVVYTPFSVEVAVAQDPKTFQEGIRIFSRTDINNNPLATLENDQAKNEMMEVTYIDGYTSLNNTF